MRYILGADIGGSHITAAVVDMQLRSIIRKSHSRRAIDSKASSTEVIQQWSGLIQESIDSSGKEVEGIGIAMPGPFDYQKGISFIKEQGKYDELYGINIKEALSVQLNRQVTDFKFDNDAACFLKGELFAGEAKSINNAFGITLGTGLGSAIAVEGEVSDGELWNSPFKGGIAEDYLSTRWFLKKYHQLSGEHSANVKQLCETGDKIIVKQLFDEFANNLKTFLETQIKALHPDVIVIGGNITKVYELFSHQLKELPIVVKKAILGEEAALLGAASSFTEKSIL